MSSEDSPHEASQSRQSSVVAAVLVHHVEIMVVEMELASVTGGL